MKIQLLIDEDVHAGLAHALRKRGYDAIHAQELDGKGRSDSDQQCIFLFRASSAALLPGQP